MRNSFTLVAILLMACCMMSLNAYAQTNFKPGYVVTLEQDTIQGSVDYRGAVRNSREISFIPDGGKAETLSAEAISGYFVNGNTFRSYPASVDEVVLGTKEKAYFLKVLESGKVVLMYLRDGDNNDRYFIVKEGGSLMELANSYTEKKVDGILRAVYDKKYLSVLRIMLTGCEQVNNFAIDIDFRERELYELIHTYNNCFRTADKSLVKKSNRLHIQPEFYVGYANTNVLVRGSSTFQNNYYRVCAPEEGRSSPVGSAVFKITSERFNRSLSLNIGFDYIRKGTFCQSTRELDFHYLDIRLYPTYTWPKGKFRPVASGGFLYGKRLNSVETAITYELKSGKRVRYSTFDPKAEIGFGAEIGADYHLKANSNSSVNFRFGYSRAIMNFQSVYLSYYNQTLYVKAGYAF